MKKECKHKWETKLDYRALFGKWRYYYYVTHKVYQCVECGRIKEEKTIPDEKMVKEYDPEFQKKFQSKL